MWPGFKSRLRRHMWVEIICSERFISGYSGFPLSSKPAFPNSNSTRNQVDEEPLCGCATSKSLFILCYFILFVFMERIQTAFIASVAVSNCTVPKPLDL